jgi:hypothetical protein
MPVGSVNGVASAPGSPKTWHSQKTRAPTVWAAIAQIGQLSSVLPEASARSAADRPRMCSLTRRL